MDLKKIFGQYAGKSVNVSEKRIKHKIGENTYDLTACTLDKEDPVIKNVFATAAKNNLEVRVWLPDTVGTRDYRTDRLNVHIEKDTDNLYKITRLDIG